MAVHLNITKLVNAAKGQMDDAVRRFTFDLFSRVIMRSPVDTGRFRGAWAIGFGAPNPSTNEGVLDPGGVNTTGTGSSKSKNWVQMELQRHPVGDSIVYLTNSLPYAMRLEYGWSKQAPYGMVRLTIIEYAAVLSNAMRAPFSL